MPPILVIDDDPAASAFFAFALRKAGHDVTVARSAAEGLHAAQEDQPRLVLCDLRLEDPSGLTGIDVLKRLRREFPRLPIAIVTGFGSISTAVEAIKLGAFDFMEKPLSLGDLANLVKRGLSEPSLGPIRPTDEVEAGVPHAFERWARAVVSLIAAPIDPRTTELWSHFAAAAPGTLRVWCSAAGLSAHRSLVFGRLLRAVRLLQYQGQPPSHSLNVVDPRTLRSLLRLAGKRPEADFPSSIVDFLAAQRLVNEPAALAAVRRALRLPAEL